jgi:CRP-like cAMP-binding protein
VLPAVLETPGVLSEPAPTLITHDFTDCGVLYWLRYFINDMGRRDAIAGGVRDRIWYSLERAGIELSFPGRTISVHEVSEQTERSKIERRMGSRMTAMRRIDLFSGFEEAAITRLAEEARSSLFAPGETVIKRGEPGDNMFVVTSGQLSVRIGSNGTESETAKLGPGAFFGEMSLLTGSPRQATVIAVSACELLVIDHETFRRLLDDHPDLARQISEKVTERSRENQAAVDATPKEQKLTRDRDALVDKIRSFFGLRRGQ